MTNHPEMSEPVLRASEIGEYLYCHRAWWLHRVQGLESANQADLARGTAAHAAHGRTVQRAGWFLRMAAALLVLALLLAVLAALSWMVGA